MCAGGGSGARCMSYADIFRLHEGLQGLQAMSRPFVFALVVGGSRCLQTVSTIFTKLVGELDWWCCIIGGRVSGCWSFISCFSWRKLSGDWRGMQQFSYRLIHNT